jgi:hypothetical protein
MIVAKQEEPMSWAVLRIQNYTAIFASRLIKASPEADEDRGDSRL